MTKCAYSSTHMRMLTTVINPGYYLQRYLIETRPKLFHLTRLYVWSVYSQPSARVCFLQSLARTCFRGLTNICEVVYAQKRRINVTESASNVAVVTSVRNKQYHISTQAAHPSLKWSRKMLATLSVAQTAIPAGRCDAMRMPFSMPAMCMSAAASARALIETDVNTSVSLFTVMLLVCSLLLVSPVIISLLLIGLAGLVRLESLVGLTIRPAIPNVQGD